MYCNIQLASPIMSEPLTVAASSSVCAQTEMMPRSSHLIRSSPTTKAPRAGASAKESNYIYKKFKDRIAEDEAKAC